MADIPKTMKAMVLYGKDDIRLVTDKPVPVPGPGEVLVKVKACGICGTDVKIITKGMPNMPPYGRFTQGHEWAGEVVALGETVDEFKIGDRVAIEAHKGCGRCANCIEGRYTACLNYGRVDKGHRASGMTVDGGFAEYAVHHINALYKIPDNVDFVQATYVTTLGCALWAFDVSGGYVAGDTALIVGPGPIGLSLVQTAKALGMETIILAGTREERLAIGRAVGATHTLNIKEEADALGKVMEITGGRGCERTFDAAGNSESFDLCMRAATRGHVMTLVSFYKQPVTASLDYAVLNSISIRTVRGEGGNNCKRALSLMAQGQIDTSRILTHTFPLEKFAEGYDTFVNRKDGAMKVVITM
ncbi:MAG: zinc-binding dehydrogenase [Gracilibacteraceae bacterium]|jgi:L-iditol 2-dehydrogenase|nr:zinc-binding dehydrogenase [Gracilibacteraceae bacterium]